MFWQTDGWKAQSIKTSYQQPDANFSMQLFLSQYSSCECVAKHGNISITIFLCFRVKN
jgi:hypothetical protein